MDLAAWDADISYIFFGCEGSTPETYILNLLLSDLLNGLGNLDSIVRLAAIDKSRASGLQTSLQVLKRLKGTELGQRSSLVDILTGHLASGNLVKNLHSLLAGRVNLVGLSGDGDGEETRVGVCVVLGRGANLREALGGLGQEREARGPLDGRLPAKERGEDGDLGPVATGAEGAGTRECNHEGIAGLRRDTLLAAKVLRGDVWLDAVLAGTGRAGEFLEELTNPLRHVSRVGAAADKGNVGLRISLLGEFGESIHIEVLLNWDVEARDDVLTQTAVESQAVGDIVSQSLCVGRNSILLKPQELDNMLVQFMG